MLRYTRRCLKSQTQFNRLYGLTTNIQKAYQPNLCIRSVPVLLNNRNLSNSSNKKSDEPQRSNLSLIVDRSVNQVKYVLTGSLEVTKMVTSSMTAFIVETVRNPASVPVKLNELYHLTMDTIHHYWVGTKLLWSEMKLTYQILGRVLRGHGMSRRERMQLMRTTADMFRLVPFMVFVIVPFMEFLLPVALKLFPNMLPSTFQDKLKREENMKQELQMRLAVAGFLQETLHSMVKREKQFADSSDAATAKEVIEFMEKARKGQPLSNESVIRIARLFQDELTLANISRAQLVMMCQYMGISPYGNDAFLRFQLRAKMRAIKEDDRRILWEGIESLTKLELREACRERGMRSVGLSQMGYKNQLNEWLDLSIQKNVPISLLVISRAFTLSSVPPESVLRDSLSALDDDVVNEVVLEAARGEEESSLEIRTRKLESLEFQKELIDAEIDKAPAKPKKPTAPATPVPVPPTPAPLTATPGPGAVSSSVSTAVDEAHPVPLEIKQTSATVAVSASPTKEEVPSSSHAPLIMERMTAAEVQAIGDMALQSAVEREKAELALLKTRGKDWKETLSLASDKSATVMDIISGFSAESEKAKAVVEAAKILAAAPRPLTQVDAGKAEASAKAAADLSNEARKGQAAAQKGAEKGGASDAKEGAVVNLKRALDNMLGKLEVKIQMTEKELGHMQLLDKDGDGIVDANELREAVISVLKRYPNASDADSIIKLLDTDKDGQVSVSEILELVRAHSEAKTS